MARRTRSLLAIGLGQEGPCRAASWTPVWPSCQCSRARHLPKHSVAKRATLITQQVCTVKRSTIQPARDRFGFVPLPAPCGAGPWAAPGGAAWEWKAGGGAPDDMKLGGGGGPEGDTRTIWFGGGGGMGMLTQAATLGTQRSSSAHEPGLPISMAMFTGKHPKFRMSSETCGTFANAPS